MAKTAKKPEAEMTAAEKALSKLDAAYKAVVKFPTVDAQNALCDAGKEYAREMAALLAPVSNGAE